MKFPELLKFLPLKLQPPRRGEGRHFLLLIFWAVHGISRTFDPLKSPLPGPGVGQICLGSNDARINPHMRAKFSCSQTVVSKKRGVQTNRQTDRHAHTHTTGHCSLMQ